MSKTPILGKAYKHKVSGGVYLVRDCLPMKTDGEWVERGATVYTNVDTFSTYVRLTPDFMDSFVPASDTYQLSGV